MVEDFSKYLKSIGLEQKTDRVIIGISGGVDSVVLTDLLVNQGFDIVLAHMNFGLRAQDSDEDERFVKELAKKYNVGLEVKKVDIGEEKTSSGKSTQMIARDLRYDWFQDLCKQYNAKLVVGHHKGDNSETFLLNLIRGTGVKGLLGMSSEISRVYRPLLKFSKSHILDYAHENNLIWREDISNQSNVYKRNKIRNKILPLFKELNPNFDETLSMIMHRLDALNDLLEIEITHFKSTWIIDKDIIKINNVTSLNSEVLYYSFFDFGFNYQSILNLQEIIKKNESGKRIDSNSHIIYFDRGQLRITIKSLSTKGSDIGEIKVSEKVSFDESLLSKYTQFFNSDKLKGNLLLRLWKAGDVFKPLGMNGSQKVSDFLTNIKVPVDERDKIQVLEVDNKIAWVVGYRISNDFRVNNKMICTKIDYEVNVI